MRCQSYLSSQNPLCLSASFKWKALLLLLSSHPQCLHQQHRHLCSHHDCVHYQSCLDTSPVPCCKHGVSAERLLRTLCDAGQVFQAVDLLSEIRRPIHIGSYVPLLKLCMAYKASALARQVYAHLVQYSSGVTPLLADYLAVTFSKCGAHDDAGQLFNSLCQRTVLSWTARICSLTNSGCPKDALQMFHFMQDDGVEPDGHTLVSLFKACGITENLNEGIRLHILAQEKGLMSNVFVGNALVSMYTKCGDTLQAQEVFKASSRRNIVSWNGILVMFMEAGSAENVLLSFRQLFEEIKDADPISLVLALQACGILAEQLAKSQKLDKFMCLEIGLSLHALGRRRYFESNLLVASSLITMYAKAGAIEEVQHVFEALSGHDLVCWNAILSAFLQQKQEVKTLQFYACMEKKGISPDHSTFTLVFQACKSIADSAHTLPFGGAKFLHIGQALHSDACKRGLNYAPAVHNSLVIFYGKFGRLLEAEHLFESMEERNVVSWTNMLSVYVSQGKGQKGLSLFRQMHKEGWTADQHLLALALQACAAFSNEGSLCHLNETLGKEFYHEVGMASLADMRNHCLCSDLFVCNVLINMYSRCVGVTEAERIFFFFTERDVVAYTTMLSAYIEHGEAEKAMQLYVFMHAECVAPNELTLTVILRGCTSIAHCEDYFCAKDKFMVLEIIRALDLDANRMGFEVYTPFKAALIRAYGKCGLVSNAETLCFPAYGSESVLRSALFSVYLENALDEKALCLFKEMQKQDIFIDDLGLVSLVQACKTVAHLDTCRELHFIIVGDGFERGVLLSSTLIHTYASCASMEDVQATFGEVVWPDDVCWTVYIDGYARSGNLVLVADILERLRLAGVEPDEILLTTMLLTCVNSGSIMEGLEYFVSFRQDHSVMERLEHYGTMVSLLGDASDSRRVKDLVSRMPVETDPLIWSSMLRASLTEYNVELALNTFAHAFLKSQVDAPMYVIMSNLCCAQGQDYGEDHEVKPGHITVPF